MQPCCRYFRPSLENKTHPNFSVSSLKKNYHNREGKVSQQSFKVH